MSNNTSTETNYEFEYVMKMVKTYYDCGRFTTEDIDDYFDGKEIEITDPSLELLRPNGTVVPKAERGFTINTTYNELTDEERNSFHGYVKEHWSESDQKDAEESNEGYCYDGDIDDDERYDDGTPETVTEQWDELWYNWITTVGDKLIWKRLAPPPAPPKPKMPEEVKEICRKHYTEQIKEAEEMIACLQRNLQRFKDSLKALDDE